MKEQIIQWGQRVEPAVGTTIYFDGRNWSETAVRASSRQGKYLGNNEVEVDWVEKKTNDIDDKKTNDIDVDWVGTRDQLMNDLDKYAGNLPQALREQAKREGQGMPDYGNCHLTISGSKIAGKTWVIKWEPVD